MSSMYIRMSWGTLRPGCWNEYRSYYNQRVVPSTEGVTGLLKRQLLHSPEDLDEGISLSVWAAWNNLLNYERSETRRKLLREVENLHDPMAYSRGEYWVKHFEIAASTHVSLPEALGTFVRLVWGKLRPGTWNEYERHYHEKVVGSPNQVQGLRERQLLRSTEDPDEGISVSIWDTLDELRNYEAGEFRQSIAKEVEHLYRGEHWVKHFEVTDSH